MIANVILLKNRNFCTHENNFNKSQKRDFQLILFCRRLIDKFPRTFYFGRIFRVPEVFESYRLLQTILFLTDSVFRVLFAYFDESMASIGGYEPWRSWNTVGLTPI